jgi:hypothetical protein
MTVLTFLFGPVVDAYQSATKFTSGIIIVVVGIFWGFCVLYLY